MFDIPRGYRTIPNESRHADEIDRIVGIAQCQQRELTAAFQECARKVEAIQQAAELRDCDLMEGYAFSDVLGFLAGFQEMLDANALHDAALDEVRERDGAGEV